MILTKENVRSVDFEKLTAAKRESNRYEELLLIVPTNRKARHLKKEIIGSSPLKAASGINVETLSTISSKILQRIKPFKQLSEAAATVFIKQCTDETDKKYFSIYKEEIPQGTLDRIKNVISEYKRNGIIPEKIRSESENLDHSEKLKALDIAEIYEKFRTKCHSLNAYEIGDVYEKLNDLPVSNFVAAFKLIYPAVNLIMLDGFSEFSEPEIQLLQKFSSVGNSKMYLRFDYSRRNKVIFSHIDKCYDRLISLGFAAVEEEGAGGRNEFKEIIKERLFLNGDRKNKIDESERISKITAPNRDDEVELISKEIKRLILNGKVEPHKICVAFNLVKNYSSIVKEIFGKNGIPVNLTDRTPLDNSNPVTAVVNYLEIIENDFYFKNIFRAVSGKFIDAEGIDLSNLYRVSSELKIVAGRQNWINILSDLISTSGHEERDDNELHSDLQAIKKALDDINAIYGMLKPFDEELAIPDFKERLEKFIIDSKLPLKLLEIRSDEEKNIRAFTDFIEITAEILDLLKTEHGPVKKFPLTFYMNQIRTACGWARFNVKEKSDYGVQVTSAEEIRGLNFDYLFVGGLCDGDFPTRYQPEIFFSGSFKKHLSAHQSEERYLFYQTLCGWNKKLYLSYPAAGGGRESVVSSFLTELEELFSVSNITDDAYDEMIFSKEQLQIELGRKGKEAEDEIDFSHAGVDAENVFKAIEVENIRNADPFGASVYTGNITAADSAEDELIKIKEELKSFAKKQYSISQLETYAKCPFKFFLERILEIKTFEEPSEEIEAIEMGRILHAIFYEFYTKLTQTGITLQHASSGDFEKAEKLIFEIAEAEVKKAAFKSPSTFYEREKILGLNGNRTESVLYKFLEAERESDADFIPKYFEVSFGRLRSDESDPFLSDSDPVEIDGIKLRGKIDRIEVNEKINSFNIVDYKLSGTKPSFSDLKKGISLQLPVYAHAASVLLSKKLKKNYSPNEMFIYSLKYSEDEFGKSAVKSKGGKDDEIQSIGKLIDNSLEHVKNYIKCISEGKYNLSELADREAKVCRYCEFRTVCRIDEVSPVYSGTSS